jgi:hypothetical protein
MKTCSREQVKQLRNIARDYAQRSRDSNEELRKAMQTLLRKQVKQLRNIARDYAQRSRDSSEELRKAMKTRSREQKEAMVREFFAKWDREKEAVRKKVETALTAEQLKTLRALVIGGKGIRRLIYDRHLIAEIEVSDKQRKELWRRLFEDEAAKERHRRLNEAWKENQHKKLAMITPKQWDSIRKLIDTIACQRPDVEVRQFGNSVVSEPLALSAEQKKRIAALFETSVAEARKLADLANEAYGGHPEIDQAAKSAELNRKSQELRKHVRNQIEALLTKQQLATFDKLFVPQEFLSQLRASRLSAGFDRSNGKAALLDRIDATAEQKRQLHELEDEADRLMRQSYIEAGETAMQILSRQQQSRLIDTLDRPPRAYLDSLSMQPLAGKQDGQSMPGPGAAASTVAGSIGNNAKGAAKQSAEIASHGPNVSIIVRQRGAMPRLASLLDEKLGKQIESIPGVTHACPGIVDFVSLEQLEEPGVLVQGWAAGSPMMKQLDIDTGRRLKKDDAKCILLGATLAAALKKRVGDTIQIFDKETHTIVGTFRSPISYVSQSIVMLLGDLQRITGHKGQVSGIAVAVDHPERDAEVNRIVAAIESLGPKIEAIAVARHAASAKK